MVIQPAISHTPSLPVTGRFPSDLRKNKIPIREKTSTSRGLTILCFPELTYDIFAFLFSRRLLERLPLATSSDPL